MFINIVNMCYHILPIISKMLVCFLQINFELVSNVSNDLIGFEKKIEGHEGPSKINYLTVE